jgi:hypothetical protein
MKRTYPEFQEWQSSWGAREHAFYRQFLKNGGRHPAMMTTLADEGLEILRSTLTGALEENTGLYLYPDNEDASFRSLEIFNLLMKEAMVLAGISKECLQISVVDLYGAVESKDEEALSMAKDIRYLFIEDFCTYYDEDWLVSHRDHKKRMRMVIASRLYSPDQVTFFRGLRPEVLGSRTSRRASDLHPCWDRDLLQLISKRTVAIGVADVARVGTSFVNSPER